MNRFYTKPTSVGTTDDAVSNAWLCATTEIPVDPHQTSTSQAYALPRTWSPLEVVELELDTYRFMVLSRRLKAPLTSECQKTISPQQRGWREVRGISHKARIYNSLNLNPH